MSSFEFGVLSYNILADYLANPEFILVEKKYLHPEKRIKLLLEFLQSQLSSIHFFFLQEVDSSQLSILVPFFRKHGMDHFAVGDLVTFFPKEVGIFAIQGGRIMDVMSAKDRARYDPKRLRQYYSVIDLLWREKPFRLVNSHLVSHPELEAAKLAQAEAIASVVLSSSKFPVIWGGDFNSKPDSRVYAFLSNRLRSVNPNESFLTTHTTNRFTPHFSETIDYIWISSPPFQVKQFIPPYPSDNPPREYAPNGKESSDHFPLRCILSDIRKSEGGFKVSSR